MSSAFPSDNEYRRRFNESLDGEGDIVIVGVSFERSRILSELDTELYEQALIDFIEQEYDELKQTVFDRYPACIAYNFRLSERGEGSADPVRKLLHLKDTWEAVVYVLYALIMGEIRHKAIDLRATQVFVSLDTGGNPIYANFNTGRILSDAIKQKAQNIKSLIQYSKANALGFKFEEMDESLLDDLLALQDIRNDISHHAAPTREQAEVELAQVNPLFQRMLTKTRFLENCRIMRFENFGSDCRCEVFAGYGLIRDYENLDIDVPLRNYVLGLGQDQLFVLWDSECFSISPFLHYHRDTSGHESYLSFFKRRRESKYWYEPVKTRDDIAFDQLQARFEAEADEVINLIKP